MAGVDEVENDTEGGTAGEVGLEEGSPLALLGKGDLEEGGGREGGREGGKEGGNGE